jgi:hypothetical protein
MHVWAVEDQTALQTVLRHKKSVPFDSAESVCTIYQYVQRTSIVVWIGSLFFDLFVFLWQPPGAVVCLGFRTIILHRHLSSAKGFSHGEVALPAGHSSKEMLSHVPCPQAMHGQASIFPFGLRREVLHRRSVFNLSHPPNNHELIKTHS